MTAAELTLYSTPTCAPCRAVKKNLDSKGIAVKVIDLTERPDALASLKERLGVPFVQTPLFEYKGQIENLTALSDIVSDIQGSRS